MDGLISYLNIIFTGAFYKMVISKTVNKTSGVKKIEITPFNNAFQLTKYKDTQVFHENIPASKIICVCADYLGNMFLQANAWDSEYEYSIMINKKGKISFLKNKNKEPVKNIPAGHDRVKNYILTEGTIIQPLIDMGIFTPSGQVVKSKYSKLKQINRFLELIDDVIKDTEKSISIIDFGCGKSYLTFIVYYYFKYIRKIDVNITGLDLKADVIKKCNESAKKYGYDNLKFVVGDIKSYTAECKIDMVISLHACDTATDYAIFNAVKWQAKYIFVVPCCQHELNEQIASLNYKLLTHYGIVKERTAALMTDAIRANVLEHCGYKTQILEFVDFENTPKNLLIRAVNTGKKNSSAMHEVQALTEEFGLKPTLLTLLKED